ncbi:MFS transporter [Alteromonas sp. NFXS44]|uniref:MFS transporter n=1 Tax=Alteromonas sp. NFXS44 TaxID=2818435 RepID=UPI0032DFC295
MTQAIESTADQAVISTSKVPLITKLLYGSGQIGGQLFRDAPAALLPLFMTTMLGVSAWVAGIVVLVPKLWVIICDPAMGVWSDKLKPHHSRRPFLAVGGLLTGLSFMALFSFSEFSSPTMAAVFIGVLFLIASTAFSAFSVPYLAMASELSSDAHERTKVLSVRMIFVIIGVIMGVGLAQPLVYKLGGDAAAWRTMAILFGGICVVAMLATAFGVPRNFGQISQDDPRKLLSRFASVKENKPFMVLAATYLVQTVAQACGYAVVGFIFLYAVADISLLFPFVIVMCTGSMLSQPMWVKLSGKWGKEAAFWVACTGWMLITITWLWVKPGDDVLMTLPGWGEMSTEHFLVLCRAVLIGFTNSGFALLVFSLLTDVIDKQRQNKGTVDEGLFSGFFSATEKLAFALGPVLAGAFLSYTGFQSSTGGAAEQAPEAIRGMVLLYSVVPAAIMAVSLLIFTRYKRAMQSM